MSHDEINELQRKARRRLIGAVVALGGVVLVLARLLNGSSSAQLPPMGHDVQIVSTAPATLALSPNAPAMQEPTFVMQTEATGGFMVRFAPFPSKKAALSAQEKLNEMSVETQIEEEGSAKKVLFILKTMPYPSKGDAERAVVRAKKAGLTGIILAK